MNNFYFIFDCFNCFHSRDFSCWIYNADCEEGKKCFIDSDPKNGKNTFKNLFDLNLI